MTCNAVIVAPWFGVNSGGAEIALLKIAEGLRDLGCAVEVYTTRSLQPYVSWTENPRPKDGETYRGFPIHRFSVDERGFDRFAMISQAAAAGQTLQLMAQDDFFRYGMTSSDLIEALAELPESTLIVGGPYYQALIHNVVAVLPGRVAIMPAFHDEPPFYFPAVNRLVRDARALLFLTESEKNLTIRHHGDAMTRAKFETPVLSLPFVNESPAPSASEPGLARRLVDRYMLYVGRIDEGKNIRQLMNWHHEMNEQRLRDDKATIPLLMVGKGVEVGFKSPHVRLLGYVGEDEKRKLIADAFGLVNLSLNESFSFVLFEAWQQGVPVIVHTNSEVLRNHVVNSEGGYHCKDLNEYSSAITEFEKPELRQVIANHGRTYAEKLCSKDQFLRRLSQIMGVGA